MSAVPSHSWVPSQEVAAERGVEDHLPVRGEVGVAAPLPLDRRCNRALTWNLLGLVSMNNALTVHAVFTKR